MHFYERIKQTFVYIYLFVLARRFYRFLKNFPNVGYDILERGYRYIKPSQSTGFSNTKVMQCKVEIRRALSHCGFHSFYFHSCKWLQ